jgi:phosphomannomutase
MGAWRFNLRRSNTEPLLRLNIEARGAPELVVEKLAQMRSLISMDV